MRQRIKDMDGNAWEVWAVLKPDSVNQLAPTVWQLNLGTIEQQAPSHGVSLPIHIAEAWLSGKTRVRIIN